MEITKYYYHSPIGYLLICGSVDGISKIEFTDLESIQQDNSIPAFLKDCVDQLDQYFSGSLKVFSLKLDIEGTEFQKKVWNQLEKIPFGEKASYGQIAVKVGGKNYMRAVGGANNRNPIPIVVPCHRVIGAGGQLVGYAGGMWRKEWLLKHESATLI